MKPWIIGPLALGAVVAGLAGVATFAPDLLSRVQAPEAVSLRIYYGGEKRAFLENPETVELLKDAGIELDAVRAGSIAMATTLPTEDVQCLWPSNEVAVGLARARGLPVRSADPIFHSPLVFYAFKETEAALQSAGFVSLPNQGDAKIALSDLTRLLKDGMRWNDVGLGYFGPIRVISTDPTKSNSGNIFSALLATGFNDGELPTAETIGTQLDALDSYFDGLGLMSDSSGKLFETFLASGPGGVPLIAGYENQLQETLRADPSLAEIVEARVSTILPEPTILASHPLVSLDDSCNALRDVLSSDAALEIAWRDHGFRSARLGVASDNSATTLTAIAPMPDADVVQAILDRLGE